MYSKFMKKTSAAVMAAAMVFNAAAVSMTGIVAADSVKYEFEDATLSKEITKETEAGASGGSVAYMTEGGSIEAEFEVEKDGTYDIIIYAHGVGGSKQQNFYINGVSQGSLSIPESTKYEPIKSTVKLNAGKNTFKITPSWGWSKFDYFTVGESVLPEIKATQTTCSDAGATAETRSLMAYLSSVYGKNIISGQQEIYSGGPHGLETEFEYLNDLTGHYPAIRGFDYGNFCCPCYGSDDGSTKRIIDWVKNKNGIATASFHLNIPNDMESYKLGDKVDWSQTTYKEKGSTFKTSNAYTEGTKEYEYYRLSLETLAKEFNKLEAEGVPVIWRPLHEAEGGGGETGSWFWWGNEGSEVYKNLWIYTYETLTNDFNCHNLIWEWNSYNFDTSENWYPGDEYVDIIGYDKYNCTKYLAENNWQPSLEHDDSAIPSIFYSLMEKYDSKKLIAMAENDCFSTVENLTNDKAGWLYFCTWYDGGSDNINFLSNPTFNTEKDTIAMYQSDYCITLDELPADLYTADTPVPVTTTKDPSAATATTTKKTTTATTTTEADPTKNFAKIETNAKGETNITLPEATSDFFLNVELPSGVTYANGGLGVSISLDGTYYWANVQWEAKKSGEVAVNVDKNFLNCSIGTEVVEDEAVIEAVKAELSKQKSYQAQIWYASDASGDAVSTSDVKIKSAYIKTEGTQTATTVTSASSVTVTLSGDANCDGVVTMADAVMILQNLANSSKYPITAEGIANADVDGEKGVTAMDALTIQKFDSGLVKELPVK